MAFLQLLAAMISSQVAAALAKNLFVSARPVDVLALRLLLASILLIVAYRSWRRPLSRHAMIEIALCGFALFLLNGFFYLAILRLNIGIVVALEFIGPLGLAIALSRRWLDVVWACIAAAGLVVLFLERAEGKTLDPIGIAFSITAGLAWAAYIVFGKRAGRTYGAGSAALTLATAACLALPLAFVWPEHPRAIVPVLPMVVTIAVLSSAVPVALELSAMPKISSRSFSVFTCLAPALATLAGWFVAHEAVDARQMVAISCIIVAATGSTGCDRLPSTRPILSVIHQTNRRRPGMDLLIPVSAGELVDKVTILRIKTLLLKDAAAANARHELDLLQAIVDANVEPSAELAALTADLTEVNRALWDIEEGKRDCERRRVFDSAFIALARSVYLKNDQRAAIKRAINELTHSAIIEEKSYDAY